MAMPTSLASGSAVPGTASTASTPTTANGSAVTPAEAATDLFAGLGLNHFGGGGMSAPQKPPQAAAPSATSKPNSITQQSKTDVTSTSGSLSLQDKHR